MAFANTAADLARRHHLAGFRVKRTAKEPDRVGWQKEATSDPEALAKLLEGREQWGVKTGNGLMVIDFDSDEARLAFEIRHNDLPKTFTVKTRRGLHVYVRVPRDYKSTRQWLGLKADLRCKGGLVIGPGSKIGESTYAIHDDLPIADAPDWLLELFDPAPTEQERNDTVLSGVAKSVAIVQALELADTAEPAIEGQHGDDRTYLTAVKLHDIGVDEDTAFGVMMRYNERCIPKWNLEDLRKKVASAYKTAQNALGSASAVNAFDAVPVDGPRNPLMFSANRWLNRDIPPLDHLLGNVLSTTVRAELVGPTGIGKSNFALALNWAIARGSPFLHWTAHRPAKRVLYIDGEMSARVARDRIADATRRHGEAPDNLILINRDDYPDLPPLNTKAGQQFMDGLIDQVADVEFVVFDNIQSLIVGDMKEEDGWAATLPWIRGLSRRSIGQLWVHHTGINTTRGYGSSTREWQLDTVMLMTDRPDKGDLLVDFELSFLKARERNRRNRADFANARIWINANDAWESSITPTTESSLKADLANAMTAFDRAQRAKALANNPAATEQEVLSTPINRSEWAIYFEAFRPTKRRKDTPIQDSASFRLLGRLTEMLVELSSVEKIHGKQYIRAKDGKDGNERK